MATTFRDIIYSNSKQICDCLIKKGMNLEEAMEVICKIIKGIKSDIYISDATLSTLGLDRCKLTGNAFSAIVAALVQSNQTTLQQIQSLTTLMNTINSNLNNAKDEKVKVRSTDTVADYLENKFIAEQAGAITTKETSAGSGIYQLMFSGFVPLGTVFMINKSRLVDFDGTGKGKENTDVWGYAVSNGNNGTVNRLGKFPRFASDPTDAGGTGGANNIKLTAAHIPSLQGSVTGTINDSLSTAVKTKTGYNVNYISDGSGGSSILMRLTPTGNGPHIVESLALDLKHTHTHQLISKYTNLNNTEISLIPEHILEIPIERIAV